MTEQTIDFHDRLLLAEEQCNLIYERRDDYLSDDDILDVANFWCTSDLDTYYDAEDDAVSAAVDLSDYERMRDSLFDLVIEVPHD